MPKVQDYVSGNILCMIKKGFHFLRYLKIPVVKAVFKRRLARKLKTCDPIKIPLDEAKELIKGAHKCAVGQRVCNALNNGADFGKSVFLDELAEGLVQAGKAEYVPVADAIETIATNRMGAIIITRVSGKHMEICRTIPKNCIYWNSEKHGLKCIQRT